MFMNFSRWSSEAFCRLAAAYDGSLGCLLAAAAFIMRLARESSPGLRSPGFMDAGDCLACDYAPLLESLLLLFSVMDSFSSS